MPLKLDIKNFGPITSGSFELKPLTIFIGPNNAGKSYAAMLTHGVSNMAQQEIIIAPKQGLAELFGESSEDLVKQVEEILTGKREKLSQDVLRKTYTSLLENVYISFLGEEISRLFTSPIRDLRRIGTKSSSLDLTLDSYGASLSYLNKGIELKSICQPSHYVDIKVLDALRQVPVHLRKKRQDVLDFVSSPRGLMVALVGFIQGEWDTALFERILSSNYLPAARSGIIQVYKEVAAGFIDRAPFAGLEKRPDIPRLSGVVADFISSLLRLKKEPGPLYDLTKNFEQRLLRGSIVISNNDLPFSEIQYQFRGKNIPLHRASSTVSELAPLFLYTKYKVEPGSLLIIEEPEAHLHPQNQRILAEFLVKLVRRGVHLLLTTHSEYLLEQFSNFIQLSRVKPRKRQTKFQYEKEVYLEADEVAAYAFRPDSNPRGTGHKIYPIEIDEEGISQEDFTQVYDSLYEESLRLHYELGNGNVG